MQQAYLFIGQSGAGKGTQADLLEAVLKTRGTEAVLRVETGEKFRQMLGSSTFTALQTKSYMERGLLPPSFLAVNIWAQTLIEGYNGLQSVIIDGTPRVANEVPLLLGAAEFYQWNLHVLYLDVTDEWAHEKTTKRGRVDDADEVRIWGRIQWFHESVMPAIELLKESPLVTFHQIHGEQSIEAVHADIAHALEMS